LNRELTKKGFIPFELNADKRLKERKELSSNKKKPKYPTTPFLARSSAHHLSSLNRLIVQVRLSTSRVVKIKISDGGNILKYVCGLQLLLTMSSLPFFVKDNPRSVAIHFGKIYSLDANAIDVLTAVVRDFFSLSLLLSLSLSPLPLSLRNTTN
jgi:hypothetical protein